MLLRQFTAATSSANRILPGLAICGLLAMAATGVAMYGGSGVVWALLGAIAIASVWSPSPVFLPGIHIAGKHVLRIGVALLGFQTSAETLQVLDAATIAVLATNVAVILIAGLIFGPMLGIDRDLSVIAAASVAICGASAAVAFALVLTRDDSRKYSVACTIGAVSLLSSVAMLAYPPLIHLLGLDAAAGGILLGGTIHEVAHAVAAGYSVDPATGEVATMAKLLRVAMLAPASILVALLRSVPSERSAVPLPPLFLLGFVAFALLNVSGLVPPTLQIAAAPLSRFCLIMAMAAIGFTLPWQSVKSYGWRPIVLLLILSAILLLLMVAFVSERTF